MKQLSVFIFITISLVMYACVPPTITERYISNAREPRLGTFVAYKNGDTIRGKRIRIKINNKDYQQDVMLDGRLMERSQIVAWQNGKYFSEKGDIRIFKGKKSLYNRTERVNIPSFHSQRGVTSSSPFTTTFTLQMEHEDGKRELVTYNSLLAAFKSCPAVLKKLETDSRFKQERKDPARYVYQDKGGILAQLFEEYDKSCQ